MLTKNVFKYYNDTYGFTTWLFVGSFEEMEKWMAQKFRYKENGAKNPNYDGEAFALVSNNGEHIGHFIRLEKFEFTCDDYGVLCHETLHVAINALHERGVIIVRGRSSETLNYLQETIFRNFLKVLMNDHKKNIEQQEITTDEKYPEKTCATCLHNKSGMCYCQAVVEKINACKRSIKISIAEIFCRSNFHKDNENGL